MSSEKFLGFCDKDTNFHERKTRLVVKIKKLSNKSSWKISRSITNASDVKLINAFHCFPVLSLFSKRVQCSCCSCKSGYSNSLESQPKIQNYPSKLCVLLF